MPTDPPTAQTAECPVVTTITPQGRKRPLRTYGRQSVRSRRREPEPPKENGKYEDENPDLGREDPTLQQPELPKKGHAEGPKRGSILAYFKPLPPSYDDIGFPMPSSDTADPTPTPPSSPPLPKPRKRRRLTTRPQFGAEDLYQKDGDGNNILADDTSVEDAEVPQGRGPALDRFPLPVRHVAHDRMRPVLGEVAANIQQHPTASAGATTDRGTRSKKTGEKRSAKDMTQTTLSLTVHKEPGFTICGVCDLLYNPLNEKDRKEHKRRHAAYTRNKGKAGGIDTCSAVRRHRSI
ncbi:hypothetical protein VTK56DRAFT_9021 [Thermocarpiscus australiensis]